MSSTYGCRAFNEQEILGQLLVQKLGGEHLATRPGGGGNLTYVEGWKAIEMANSLFGFEGWSCSVELLTPDFVEEKNGRFSVGVTAVVRIVLKDGTFHEDVGFGQSEQRQKGMAIEFAKKEAVTDARKRALRFFGNALGNCVYDKEHLKSIKAGKVAMAPISFNGLRNGTTFINKTKPPAFLTARSSSNQPTINNNNLVTKTSSNPPPPIATNPNQNINPPTNTNAHGNSSFLSKYSDTLNTNNVSNNNPNPSSAPPQPTTFSFSANYNSNTTPPPPPASTNTNTNVPMNIRDSMMNNMMNNLNNSGNFNSKTEVLSPPQTPAPNNNNNNNNSNTVSPNNPYLQSSRTAQSGMPAFDDDSFDNDVFALADQALQAYQQSTDPTPKVVPNFANNQNNYSSPQQQQQQASPQTPSPSRSPYQQSSSSSSSPYQQQQQQYKTSPYATNPQDIKDSTPPDKKRKFFVDVSA